MHWKTCPHVLLFRARFDGTHLGGQCSTRAGAALSLDWHRTEETKSYLGHSSAGVENILFKSVRFCKWGLVFGGGGGRPLCILS